MRLAIIGQGKSGKKIHGAYLRGDSNRFFEVAYVVEADERAQRIAAKDYPGASILSDYRKLLTRQDIDIVVNASYSDCHFPITLDLLRHGFSVLVEKPFSETRAECELLIETAREHGVLLAVFQQSNLAPFFRFAKKVMQSGRIGELKQISLRYGGLARRWDWQTYQKHVAGSLYNTGPHPLGMAMSLLDFDPAITLAFSRLDTALTAGDADDYAKLILTAPGRAVADIEISAADAYPEPLLKLQGDRGTLRAGQASYELTYFLPEENVPRRATEVTLRDENYEPIYCSERLLTHTETGKFEGSAFDVGTALFYENLYHALRGEEALCFPPEEVARLIGFIEQAHRENPLPQRF